jgi:hypothetical protein
MSAVLIPSREFRNAHEAHAQLCDAADANEMDADWSPVFREDVTDADVEQFIAALGVSGAYEDELGAPKTAPSLFKAVARQWILDKEAVGEIIGPVFWNWARAAARLAKFGK